MGSLLDHVCPDFSGFRFLSTCGPWHHASLRSPELSMCFNPYFSSDLACVIAEALHLLPQLSPRQKKKEDFPLLTWCYSHPGVYNGLKLYIRFGLCRRIGTFFFPQEMVHSFPQILKGVNDLSLPPPQKLKETMIKVEMHQIHIYLYKFSYMCLGAGRGEERERKRESQIK